ncbi:UNVERIFIED_CONTAM: hypothetical protein PYX00_009988 [Menopon gallinae]|uniref:Uncharacterized protein n=1 Tax=Menopon gallinae TaxID=328185 RepID=A0AAW2HDN1_9NEOP
MYHHPMQHSPNLSLRQSSPYPVESTNIQQGGGTAQSRHKGGYQQSKKPSLRNKCARENSDKSDKNSVRESAGNFPQREHMGLGSREQSSGTLTSRGRISNRRHQQNNGMTSSTSSNSSISDNNDNYEVDHRGRLNIENDLNGDSPPEPAPPEVPPRGPSLHHAGNAHTLRSSRNAGDRGLTGQDIFLSQGELLSYFLFRLVLPSRKTEAQQKSSINKLINSILWIGLLRFQLG